MFTLILGPMKSGKSLELIARVAPYEFANREVLYIQPQANVRDKGINSRIGINTTAITVKSLNDVTPLFDVIGIDEIHMFEPNEVSVIERWINEGKSVFITGLDLDYRGKMPPIIAKLLELKPDNLLFKIAVCDVCKKYEAQFTQIVHNDKPVLGGLPLISPEDEASAYVYQARCRNCFVKK